MNEVPAVSTFAPCKNQMIPISNSRTPTALKAILIVSSPFSWPVDTRRRRKATTSRHHPRRQRPRPPISRLLSDGGFHCDRLVERHGDDRNVGRAEYEV